MMKEYKRPVVELAEGLSEGIYAASGDEEQETTKDHPEVCKYGDGRQIRVSICVRPVPLQMAYLQMVRDISGRILPDVRKICQ